VGVALSYFWLSPRTACLSVPVKRGNSDDARGARMHALTHARSPRRTHARGGRGRMPGGEKGRGTPAAAGQTRGNRTEHHSKRRGAEATVTRSIIRDSADSRSVTPKALLLNHMCMFANRKVDLQKVSTTLILESTRVLKKVSISCARCSWLRLPATDACACLLDLDSRKLKPKRQRKNLRRDGRSRMKCNKNSKLQRPFSWSSRESQKLVVTVHI